MFGSWNDFDRTLAAMNHVRRHVERAMNEDHAVTRGDGFWPRATMKDDGHAFVITVDVPGLGEKDIDVTLADDVVTLTAQRKERAHDGYSVHRQERRALSFTRAFSLPAPVEGSAITASLKDGVLTVTMPKTPERQPRQIPVRAV